MDISHTDVPGEVSVYVNTANSEEWDSARVLQEMARLGFAVEERAIASVGGVKKKFILKVARREAA